jgi:hypothetical protein
LADAVTIAGDLSITRIRCPAGTKRISERWGIGIARVLLSATCRIALRRDEIIAFSSHDFLKDFYEQLGAIT